jgi:protoporphyrinogen IX oxidase
MIALYLKAIHIIFVVTWFAGLFYIVRLFIYHTEANDNPELERDILQRQYKIMEKRLWYGITWPSLVLTWIIGLCLIYFGPWFQSFHLQGWLHLKLSLVVLLSIYHLYCGKLLNEINKGYFRFSSNQLRIFNEVATLFLVAIVFVVVLKSAMDVAWGIAGLLLFAIVLLLAIKIYKLLRKEH